MKNITIQQTEEMFKNLTPMQRRKLNVSIRFRSPNFGGGRETNGRLRSISERGISFDGNNGKTRNKHITRDDMEIITLTDWS